MPMKKADIETYYHGGQWYPSVNVKVHKGIESVTLPLILGQVREADETEFRTIYTDDQFTHDWIYDNVNMDDDIMAFDVAIENGRELIREEAERLFGKYIKVWFVGRSGGHCIVEGLDDLESWDAIAVTTWTRFVKYCKAVVDDAPRIMVECYYDNLFLNREEISNA